MTAPEIVLVAAASWSILAIAVGLPLGRLLRTQDDTQRAVYPPPVPPPAARPDESTWLDQWPTDVEPADIDTLEQRVYDRLFDELIAIEGLQ